MRLDQRLTDDGRWKLWRTLDVAVIVAAVMVIPALILGDSSDRSARDVATVLDWVSWSVFASEFAARLALDPARRAWLRSEWFMVAITLVTFPVLPAGLGVLRLARLSRLLRLLRLLRLVTAFSRLRHFLTPGGFKSAALLASLIVVGGAAVFAHAEHKGFGDALWWAVVTSATVGYGELYPTTVVGRVTAVVVMVVGISMFALVTGAIAKSFLASETRAIEQEVEMLEEHDELILRQVETLRSMVTALESELRAARQRGPSGRPPA